MPSVEPGASSALQPNNAGRETSHDDELGAARASVRLAGRSPTGLALLTAACERGNDNETRNNAPSLTTPDNGTLLFSMKMNEVSARGTCLEGAAEGAPNKLRVAIISGAAFISCPGPAAGYENPYLLLTVRSIESLPAEFSFSEEDTVSWSLAAHPADRHLEVSGKNAAAATLNGTWDAEARQLTGTFDATFTERPGLKTGSLEAAFNVTVP